MLGEEGGEAVGDGDGFGFDLDGGGGEAFAGGGEGDGAGGAGGADGDAVDATFGVEVEVVGGVGFSTVVAAAPDARAGHDEIDAVIIGGAALTFGIDDFDIEEGDITAIGLETVGPDDGGEFDGGGGAGGFDFHFGDLLVVVVADGADGAGGECDVGEGEDKAVVGLGVFSPQLSVDIEFDGLGVGDDVNGFLSGFRVGPVAEDVEVGVGVLRDAAPRSRFPWGGGLHRSCRRHGRLRWNPDGHRHLHR